MSKSAKRLLYVCLLVFGIVSHQTANTQTREKKSWTYLFYVAGDESEVDRYSRVPIRKLEQVGSDSSRWIVAHADLYFDLTGTKMISEPARRYQIEKHVGPINAFDYSTLKIESPEVWHSASETNSGSGESLRDFIEWGTREYPADHYALFMLGHAWGWRGLALDENPGFAIPQPKPGPEIDYLMMSLSEFREAISGGMPGRQKLDLLVMDMCNTGVMEVAYEIRDLVRVLVAAPTEVPFFSFDYEKTFKRRVVDQRDLSRYLVQDSLESFVRGGAQAPLEGDYSALSMFSLDLEAMPEIWDHWGTLTKELPTSNFKNIFMGAEHSQWPDQAHNIDVTELLGELEQNSDSPRVRQTAAELSPLLGGHNPTPAPDSIWYEFPTAGATNVHITLQGDELLPEDKVTQKAGEFFDYLNPHLTAIPKTWTVVARGAGRDRRGRPDRILKVEFVLPIGETTLRIRPFIAAASWVNIEFVKDGKAIHSEHLEQPSMVYLRETFPQGSPYIVSGNTFGAGRNRGLSVNIDGLIDPTHWENHHLQNGVWIGGRDYYRSLSFTKAFGWGELLF